MAKETHRRYVSGIHVREEAGTPGVIESIRCGLAFRVRNLVGVDTIERLEGEYAAEAVKRMQASKIWVMGDTCTDITSKERLSITSFNIWTNVGQRSNRYLADCLDVPKGTLMHPSTGNPLMIHYHFVAALLNDLYGIQARSGCACAGPLTFRLFGPRYAFMVSESMEGVNCMSELSSLMPGFCRVNFNYFIDREEFDFIVEAIRQIAEHGWKLLPLYTVCLKTGQYVYNGLDRNSAPFQRFATLVGYGTCARFACFLEQLLTHPFRPSTA